MHAEPVRTISTERRDADTNDRDVELTARPTDAAADATAAAVRRLIGELLRAGEAAGHLDAVAEQINQVADRLHAIAQPLDERLIDMWHGEGVPRHDPVTGPENAIAPPLRLYGRPDRSVHGVVVLGLPYQGPPGCAHGGVSALLLDHALGVANSWAGHSGMTAQLTVSYLRPTPLFVPLAVVGRQVGVDGHKIYAEGTIAAGNTICVRASGLFIDKQVPRPGPGPRGTGTRRRP